MSEQHDDSSRNLRHTTDVHSYRSNDPHTAIPDWLAFAPGIGPEARNLIMASLILEKLSGSPTRRQLAEALSVDERTIYRWLREIGKAGMLSTRRDRRRRVNVFHKPIPDRMISDHAISDHAISDRPIRYYDYEHDVFPASDGRKATIPDRAISDPSVGGGGDHHALKDSPTSIKRGPLKTALARWLKRAGMSAAREFDDIGLDYRQYREFVESKRYDGWSWNQIVSTLREAPLHAPINDQVDAGEVDQVDQVDAGEVDAGEVDAGEVDSTTRQLARRFEADRLEALARGAGLVNERGKTV